MNNNKERKFLAIVSIVFSLACFNTNYSNASDHIIEDILEEIEQNQVLAVHKRYSVVPNLRIPLRPDPANSYRSYQRSIYCTPSLKIQSPKNISELIEIVKNGNGVKLKVIGSRHSITDLICTDGIPLLLSQINHTTDNEDGTASFGAGIELAQALQFLEERNKTLIHVPAYGGITLGGAIGTGAHGSSLIHPTSISDQLVKLKVIDGTGSLREIFDPEINAFRVNLGLLGIIVEVTLQTVPLFKMRVENKLVSESILLDGTALKWSTEFDWFQMWWFPSTKNVVVSKGIYNFPINSKTFKESQSSFGNATSQFIPELDPLTIAGSNVAYETLQTTKNREGFQALEKFTEASLYDQVIGKPPLFSEDGITMQNPAIGNAWRLLSNKCVNFCPWDNGAASLLVEESSVGLSHSKLPDAVKEIKKVLEKIPAHFSMVGIFIRFSKASPSIMGISSGRTTVTLEWATTMRSNPYDDPREGIGAYQAILQTLVHKHEGRPHWGKNGLYYFTQDVLKKSIENRRDMFISAMKKYDPNGIFMNKFGERILGLSDKMDVDPEVHHCALQDYCKCQKNEDCGPYQTCVKFEEFPICRDFVDIYLDTKLDPTNLTSIWNAIGILLN